MKILIIKLLSAFLLLFSTATFSQQPDCTADSIKSWVHFLASDEMKGRANGSEEIEKVTDWISALYQQYGLKTVANMTDFVQPYILYEDSSFVHKNIIGYIPGKDENANVVVVSAHFDHIGMRRTPLNGDSIYNGADDNASGVAAMLAIAKNFYQQNLKPDCSIIFAAFSNEETGLIGSMHFCESNLIPMQNIKININFDMVGRTDDYGNNKYYVTGSDYSNFQDIVIEFNKDNDWEIAEAGMFADMFFDMSDNYAFAAYGRFLNHCVPAHTIATSLGFEYIHELHDEAEYINFENMTNLVNNMTQLLLHIASNEVIVNCK
jgi:hypothetical protein